MKNKNKTTKFPVARIKRIMQKDEEVGKVAQATPIVICEPPAAACPSQTKALELFLAMLVDEASKVTIQRGSKKVEPYHLKHAIDTVDMLDFLKEIVQAVPDPSAGGTRDIEPETSESARKKRGKRKSGADAEGGTRRRRRKGAAEKKDEEEMEQEEDAEGDDAPGAATRKREDDDDDDWEG
ncbi:hypothetical protein CERSUDRAFT_53135 [Gelatoporia subvermispora B]|uniref:Transcription factor CBF/NF-Y/archaeal histone domain-containing protein n=1 Tax=Ceriporiopsis subvermispora (strain B) TaxID=914234 RepID=M2PI34_CERS8|nr:hypothetical protein CERSUDRAFT_53135 [Gelatoporia subvermispora B]